MAGLDRGTRLALVAMAAGVFVIANDFTSMSVALPKIESDFDADVSTVQWVINAYALVFGVLIVTGGRLADMLGRRRMFFTGAAIFAGFSVLGGAAQSELWLIACRALMGVGGAMMWPAVLGMTFDVLPDDKAGLAGGLILGAAGFGNAMGPLIGGFLTDALSWRWILFLNLPVALFACFVTARTVRESRGEDAGERLDYAGVATLSTGLVALLIALDQVTDWGWTDPRILALFAGCVVLLAAFAAIERRAGANALVPGDVMGNATFRAACLAVLLMSATFFAALVYLPQFVQKILDYSPFEAGLALLPLMATFAATSFAAGTLYERLGARTIITAGASCLFAGSVLLSLISRDWGWGALVPGMLVLGMGIGLFYSSITTTAVTALDPSRSSLAGGLVYMFQVAGGSIGLGLTTTIFTTAAEDSLQKDLAGSGLDGTEQNALHGALAGTESSAQLLARFSERTADRLIDVVRDAFVSGMQWGFRTVALLALGGLLVSVLYIGRPRAEPRAEAAPAPSGTAS
jgi:EmrB/QacA subfamily drug resistance transporter